ncbi:Optineurin [Nymphon striatum]|nr:Optineurin [Nymphon striatum]
MQASANKDINFNLKDLKMSLASMKVTEMTREETENKLLNVLKENIELKEILEQNNIAMKQQFQTLLAWQDQVKTIHDEHKRKFEATKELVIKLKGENQELTKKANVLENTIYRGTPNTSANNSQDKSTSASQVDLITSLFKYDVFMFIQFFNCFKTNYMQNLSRILKLFGVSLCINTLMFIYTTFLSSLESPKANQMPELPAHISVEEAKSAIQYERERVQLEHTVEQLKEDMEKMKATIQHRTEQTNPDISALLGESTPRSISPSMSWDSSDVLYESTNCTVDTSPGRSPARRRISEYVSEEAQTMTSGPSLRMTNEEQNRIIHLTQLLIEEKKKVTVLQAKLDMKIIRTKDQTTSSSIDVQSQQLIKELKISEEKFTLANNCLQKYKERCDSLENWLSVYQGKLESLRTKDNDTIDQLRSELENMKENLNVEQRAKFDEQKNLQDAREQFEKLVKDYQELMKTWENFQRDQENKDRQAEAWSMIQQRQMQEKLDRLTAKLVTSEEARSHMTQDYNTLKSQCERNRRELESIPILKSQVDLYKEELEKEKELKQKVMQTASRLQSDLQNSQSQNFQLIDEINAYNETRNFQRQLENNNDSQSRSFKKQLGRYVCPVSTQEESAAEMQGRSVPVQAVYPGNLLSGIKESISTIRLSTGEEANRNLFYCPKCNVAYSNYAHIVKHVEACLNAE